jgi:hypothetical protein
MFRRAYLFIAALTITFQISCAISAAEKETAQPKSLDDDYVVGSWKVKGCLDGEAVMGSMQVRPSAGGMCLIFNWTLRAKGAEPIRGTAVGGLDPTSNEFVECCFESNGSHFINRYPGDPIEDEGVGYGERIGTIKGKEYKGKITVDRKGRDQFTYTVVSEKGEDVSLTFTRAAVDGAKPKRKKQ